MCLLGGDEVVAFADVEEVEVAVGGDVGDLRLVVDVPAGALDLVALGGAVHDLVIGEA
jgi:hypothetical protein